MLFTVCQNSIGKYDFGSVVLYAPPGVLQVAKSPVLLGLNQHYKRSSNIDMVYIHIFTNLEISRNTEINFRTQRESKIVITDN